MTAPIVNPPIPLLNLIPGGFLHGKIIRIHGSANPSAHRFAINLQCGPSMSPLDDLALHLNVKFHDAVVARNSLLSGAWGHEEHHGPHFPFHHGQGFEVLLLADANHYKIAVNGQHFTEFIFRTAPERVSYLSIDGDVMISAITFEGESHGASGLTPGHLPPLGPGHGTPSYLPQPGMPTPLTPGHLPPLGPGIGAPPYPSQPGMVPGMVPGVPYVPSGKYPPGSRYGNSHASSYPSYNPGYPSYPGQPGPRPMGVGPMGVGAGGLLGGLGTVMGAAAMGKAVLNPKKALKQQRKAQKKAMKYGIPIAGVAVGGYALHKGMKGMKHGFHGSSSSSSSSSSEEE